VVGKKFEELLQRAKGVEMSDRDKEAQRRSFAFGNTNIENERITRKTIDAAAKSLGAK